jgi:hypothetical protein
MGSDAYHTETKRTRLLVKKKRCYKGFVNDGGLGGGRQGGKASGATCFGDRTALGQREARVSVIRDEGKTQGRPKILHFRRRASTAGNVPAAEDLTASAQVRGWGVVEREQVRKGWYGGDA